MTEARLMTLDPGHFHAALVQKEMYPGVSRLAHVYAPLGPDLLAHLGRIAGFNARRDNPTSWQLEIHAGPDPLEQMLSERPGNVVILSGRNRGKIDRIVAALEAGLHVLADKPWIIEADDLPRLQAALDTATARGVIAYDIMTERYEITSILQRELVHSPEVFGTPEPGTPAEPGVFMASVHYLLKLVAGVPNRRPAWFFDVGQQGEGLTDVGTHLVDLVMWILFPAQAIAIGEVSIAEAARWPTVLTRDDFARVTGEPDFPDYLRGHVAAERLRYFCNTRVDYAVRGVHVRLDVRWDYEVAAGGGDLHFASFRGSRSRVEVRQGREENYRPEVYVVPNRGEDRAGVLAALRDKVVRLQGPFPGVAVVEEPDGARVHIPDSYRVGHEAHFGEVTRQFLHYLADPAKLPAWEKPNMAAKYHITTEGVRRARANPVEAAP